MRRVINFRPFLFTALCCIAVTLIFVYSDKALSITISSVLFALLVVAGVVYAIIKKPVKSTAFILCALCVFSVGLNFNLGKKSHVCQLDETIEYDFSARVCSISKGDYGATLLLENVTASGVEVDGKISLSVTQSDNLLISFLREGDEIKFTGSARYYSYYDDVENGGYASRNDIRYYSKVNESEVTFVRYSPSFFQRLRNKIYDTLEQNLDEYAPLAYGMITGETGEISAAIRSYYSASGLGHILAVSGLHVGFVVTVLLFLLKKLKANKWIRLSVVTIALIFYCFLAGFSSSMVRATVMCLVGMVADAFGKRKDPLSSLCFAVTVILLWKPLFVFDVGFQMSVGAVFGIILFASSFQRFFGKVLPKFVSRALAVSLSAQIGIAFITVRHFSSFATYSIITNIFMIPVVTVAFIAITVTLVIALIIPSAGILLSFAGVLMAVIDMVAKYVSLLPASQLRVFAFDGIMLLMILLLLCSRFFMLPRLKWALNIACVVVIAVVTTLFNLPYDEKYDFTSISSYKDVTAVIRTNGEVVLVGDCTDYNAIDDMLEGLKERRIDKVYLTNCTVETANALVRARDKYKVGVVYCPSTVDLSGTFNLINEGFIFRTFNAQSTVKNLTPVFFEGSVAYKYTEANASILLLGYGTKIKNVPVETINECSIIRAYTFVGEYDKRCYIVNYENQYIDEKPDHEKVLQRSAFVLDLKSGKYRENI